MAYIQKNNPFKKTSAMKQEAIKFGTNSDWQERGLDPEVQKQRTKFTGMSEEEKAQRKADRIQKRTETYNKYQEGKLREKVVKILGDKFAGKIDTIFAPKDRGNIDVEDIEKDINKNPIEEPIEEPSEVANFGITDDMDFDEAFKIARQKGVDEFTYKGKPIAVKLKEDTIPEWKKQGYASKQAFDLFYQGNLNLKPETDHWKEYKKPDGSQKFKTFQEYVDFFGGDPKIL